MRAIPRHSYTTAILLASLPLAAAPGQVPVEATEVVDAETMHRSYVDQYADTIEAQTLSGDCYVFTRRDVERMAHTLTDTIWNGSLSAPRFSNYINGGNKPYRPNDKPYDVGNVCPGWALFGEYSTEARRILSHTLKAIGEGQTVGQNASSYGYVALNGHLLRNSRPTFVHPQVGVGAD